MGAKQRGEVALWDVMSLLSVAAPVSGYVLTLARRRDEGIGLSAWFLLLLLPMSVAVVWVTWRGWNAAMAFVLRRSEREVVIGLLYFAKLLWIVVAAPALCFALIYGLAS